MTERFYFQHVKYDGNILEIKKAIDPIILFSVPPAFAVLWFTYTRQPLFIYALVPAVLFGVYTLIKYELTIIDFSMNTYCLSRCILPHIILSKKEFHFDSISYKIEELGKLDHEIVIYSHYLIFNVDGATFRTINLMQKSNIKRLSSFMSNISGLNSLLFLMIFLFGLISCQDRFNESLVQIEDRCSCEVDFTSGIINADGVEKEAIKISLSSIEEQFFQHQELASFSALIVFQSDKTMTQDLIVNTSSRENESENFHYPVDVLKVVDAKINILNQVANHIQSQQFELIEGMFPQSSRNDIADQMERVAYHFETNNLIVDQVVFVGFKLTEPENSKSLIIFQGALLIDNEYKMFDVAVGDDLSDAYVYSLTL